MPDRAREHSVPGEEVGAARAEQRLSGKTLAARPPQDREIERLVDDHGIVAGAREMVERMAREGQALHQSAKARTEVRPVLLDAERELHQLHLAVACAAAVAGDDGHGVAAARKRAAGLPAVSLEPAGDEAGGDVVETDLHVAASFMAPAPHRPSA